MSVHLWRSISQWSHSKKRRYRILNQSFLYLAFLALIASWRSSCFFWGFFFFFFFFFFGSLCPWSCSHCEPVTHSKIWMNERIRTMVV
jgi:hypothetical protein